VTTIGQSIGDNLVALKKPVSPVSLMTKACPNQILATFLKSMMPTKLLPYHKKEKNLIFVTVDIGDETKGCWLYASILAIRS
jgi:hypothetical protein